MSGAFPSTRRPPDWQARGASPGSTDLLHDQRRPGANDNCTAQPAWGSAFPPGARAIIEAVRLVDHRVSRRLRDQWRLRFEPRGSQFADPLTGWTGGRDPLVHVALRFPSSDEAVRYCMRQRLPYVVRVPKAGFGGDTAWFNRQRTR